MTDDFYEWHAAAIEIERRHAIRIRQPFVQRLARVLLEVDTDDSHALRLAARLELEHPLRRQRAVVLRDLVPLRKVRVEVVLARENRGFVHGAPERERRLH